MKYGKNFSKFAFLLSVGILFFPVQNSLGHGWGIDTISSIEVAGKEISVSVEMPMYFSEEGSKQITITATDRETKENPQNVTFLVGLFHENEMIFRNYFFAPEGNLAIKVNPTDDEEIKIIGEQDSLLGAYHGTESQPIEITGPIFESGGLFHFEIEIRTIDDPTNIVEDLDTYFADVSVVETTSYLEKDLADEEVKFRMKSYFDKISQFEYDPIDKTVTFEMPFDWSDEQIIHIPVVHDEVHFPKDFVEFLAPSYIGEVNGIKLFKSSVTVDDYTEEEERIVHFVLLADHLKFLQNEQEKLGKDLPNTITFTLRTSEKTEFPMKAMTKNEELQVDLSWDPIQIEPGKKTTFVFTIRDGTTGDPMRNSSYDFVLIQSGKEIYKSSGNAAVGGYFEEFTFSETQTGPTIIRFENIRGTGLDTEFGVVVVPEFGMLAGLVLIIALISIIILGKKTSIKIQNF